MKKKKKNSRESRERMRALFAGDSFPAPWRASVGGSGLTQLEWSSPTRYNDTVTSRVRYGLYNGDTVSSRVTLQSVAWEFPSGDFPSGESPVGTSPQFISIKCLAISQPEVHSPHPRDPWVRDRNDFLYMVQNDGGYR